MYGVSGTGEAEELPDPPKLKKSRAQRAVDAIDDSGLLFNTIPMGISEKLKCWKCDKAPKVTDLDLCQACDDWLHDNNNFPDAPLIEEHPPFGEPNRRRT